MNLQDYFLPQVFDFAKDRVLSKPGLRDLISGKKAVEDWPCDYYPGVEIVDSRSSSSHRRIPRHCVSARIVITLILDNPGSHSLRLIIECNQIRPALESL